MLRMSWSDTTINFSSDRIGHMSLYIGRGVPSKCKAEIIRALEIVYGHGVRDQQLKIQDVLGIDQTIDEEIYSRCNT